MQREVANDNTAVGSSLLNSLDYIFQIDPIIFLLWCASIIVFSYIIRDHFVLLWVFPFLIFLFVIDFVSFFHLILLLPAICISAASLIVDLSSKVKKIKFQQILPFVVISVIGVFGLASIIILITLNVSSSYFDVYAFVVQYLTNHYNQLNKNKEETLGAVNEDNSIMLGRHWARGYFWIPKHVFDINIDFMRINQAEDIPVPTVNDKILLIVDNPVRNSLSDRDISTIQKYYCYYTITPVATFEDKTIKYDTSKYPYASISENRDTRWVQIRAFNLSNNRVYD